MISVMGDDLIRSWAGRTGALRWGYNTQLTTGALLEGSLGIQTTPKVTLVDIVSGCHMSKSLAGMWVAPSHSKSITPLDQPGKQMTMNRDAPEIPPRRCTVYLMLSNAFIEVSHNSHWITNHSPRIRLVFLHVWTSNPHIMPEPL
jgi:hypothetical protein